MNFATLLDGWNLAFALPLLLALLYLGLYVASGITFGDVDGNGDVDANGDGHADGDVEGHAHHDLHAAHPGGQALIHHHEGAQHADPHGQFTILSWLGIGRVPISLWLTGMMLGWGAAGLGASAFVHTNQLKPPTSSAVVLGIALLGALVFMRGLTVLVTRVVPIHESYARRRHELLGSEGEAIYAIDETFGMVGVRNAHGELFQLGCRVDNGQPIAKGTRVKLVAYNRDTNLYHVVPSNAVPTPEPSTA